MDIVACMIYGVLIYLLLVEWWKMLKEWGDNRLANIANKEESLKWRESRWLVMDEVE
jgi:hypothetical protein